MRIELIIIATITKVIARAKGSQIGENTQSQDQEITLHNFNTINTIVRSPQIEKIITFSLTDSLPKDKEGNHYNPYAEIDDKFEHFKNNVSLFKKKFSEKIVSKNEFLEKGETYEGNIVEEMSLSDLCQITYTSGTTKPGYPKGCKHSNRNYLTFLKNSSVIN